MEKVSIRPATVNDMPTVHRFVYDLAVYENEPEAVFTSPEEYAEDFNNGLFEAFVAEIDGEIVGSAVYYMAYSTWKGKMLYLDDFMVAENKRQFGIGQQLFDRFIEEAKIRGCRMVKWQVLDWNEPAIKFYEKNKAIIEKEWWNGKIFLFEL
jgi:GNAT superfamily N-acetyltransferase